MGGAARSDWISAFVRLADMEPDGETDPRHGTSGAAADSLMPVCRLSRKTLSSATSSLVGSPTGGTVVTTTGSGTYHVVPASQPFFGCLFVGSYGNSNVYYCAA